MSWMTFTPKLRRKYKRWIVEGLGLSWALFAPAHRDDLPDA